MGRLGCMHRVPDHHAARVSQRSTPAVPRPSDVSALLAGVADGTALYDTDAFRMHAYKVLTCNRRYSHDW